eukprot:662591-Pelagomonas_calceolata.AAC.6
MTDGGGGEQTVKSAGGEHPLRTQWNALVQTLAHMMLCTPHTCRLTKSKLPRCLQQWQRGASTQTHANAQRCRAPMTLNQARHAAKGVEQRQRRKKGREKSWAAHEWAPTAASIVRV